MPTGRELELHPLDPGASHLGEIPDDHRQAVDAHPSWAVEVHLQDHRTRCGADDLEVALDHVEALPITGGVEQPARLVAQLADRRDKTSEGIGRLPVPVVAFVAGGHRQGHVGQGRHWAHRPAGGQPTAAIEGALFAPWIPGVVLQLGQKPGRRRHSTRAFGFGAIQIGGQPSPQGLMGPGPGQGVLLEEQQGHFGAGTIGAPDDRREIREGGLRIEVLQGQHRPSQQELRIGRIQRQTAGQLLRCTLGIVGLQPEQIGGCLGFGVLSQGRCFGG
jgi:hypothetical protein